MSQSASYFLPLSILIHPSSEDEEEEEDTGEKHSEQSEDISERDSSVAATELE